MEGNIWSAEWQDGSWLLCPSRGLPVAHLSLLPCPPFQGLIWWSHWEMAQLYSQASLCFLLHSASPRKHTLLRLCPLRRNKLAQQGRTLEVQLGCGAWESLLITSDALTNSLSNYTLIRLLISSVSVTWMTVFSCLSHESKAISLGADIKMHPLSLPSYHYGWTELNILLVSWPHGFPGAKSCHFTQHTPPAWAPAPLGAAFI